MHYTIGFVVLLVLLSTPHPASAYYDPGVQRWINRDPMEERGSINLYSYVGDNPANKIDPLGLWQWGWPPWGKPKQPPSQPPQKPQSGKCCNEDNPAKDLFKTAADTLAGEIGGTGGAMVRLLLLAADAKQGCGDMKGAANTCSDFAHNPSQEDAYQCCMAIMNSFPGLGGYSYFQCHAMSAKY